MTSGGSLQTAGQVPEGLAAGGGDGFTIRAATAQDLPAVVALDAEITGLAKPEYWHGMFERFSGCRRSRFCLVADTGSELAGFVMGEIRAWEFGSPPCGWVFAVSVKPGVRLGGIGTALFVGICEGFRQAGATKVRTMLRRDAHLMMSFFRSQGMMAGPFLELGKDLDV